MTKPKGTVHKLPRERRQHDELRLVTRARIVMADCRRVLVRASEEDRLLQDMCRIAVESGGYRTAWIGLVRHDQARTIEPVASAGDRDDFLASMRISWADNEFGRGPAGAAVRTRKPQALRNIQSNRYFSKLR